MTLKSKRNNRLLRLVAGSLTVALLLIPCGCKQSLNQTRSSRAVYTEQGDVLYNGQIYLNIFQEKLNDYYYNPQTGLLEYPILYGGPDTTIYVTQPDVPVLLKKAYGDAFTLSGDGVYLLHHLPAPLLGAPEERYYCRADVYDQCLPPLAQDEESCFYEYQTYDSEHHRMQEELTRYPLTKEQSDAVEQVLTTVTPEDAEGYVVLDDWYPFHLYHMQDGHLRYRITVIADGDSHQLATSYDGENFTVTYAVPQNLEPIFEAITNAGVKEQIAYDSYLDQYYETLS